MLRDLPGTVDEKMEMFTKNGWIPDVEDDDELI